MAGLLVLPRPSKSVQKCAGDAFVPRGKETEPSVRSSRSSGGRESNWARTAPGRERGGSEREHEKERVNSTVKKGRF